MNLSNIFEYMDKKLFTETAEKLIQRLEDDGRIGYWNLMVPRRISGIFPSEVRYLSKLSQQLTEDEDRKSVVQEEKAIREERRRRSKTKYKRVDVNRNSL